MKRRKEGERKKRVRMKGRKRETGERKGIQKWGTEMVDTSGNAAVKKTITTIWGIYKLQQKIVFLQQHMFAVQAPPTGTVSSHTQAETHGVVLLCFFTGHTGQQLTLSSCVYAR